MVSARNIKLVALAMVGAAGCLTDNGEPLLILQNQVPSSGCVIPNDSGSSFLPRGRIDVGAPDGLLTSGYILAPLVQNIGQTSDDTPGQRVALIQGADVDITLQEGFIDTATLSETELADFQRLTSFSKFFSGSVQPNGGLTSFGIEVIPEDLMDRFIRSRLSANQELEVRVQIAMFGKMDGSDIGGVPFDYYIDICAGADWNPGSKTYTGPSACLWRNLGQCSNLADSFEAAQGGECNPIQDFALDCCDESGVTICPAVGPSGSGS